MPHSYLTKTFEESSSVGSGTNVPLLAESCGNLRQRSSLCILSYKEVESFFTPLVVSLSETLQSLKPLAYFL
jgi:hypothetical protein